MHSATRHISVSVVIPVWNDAVALGEALPALLCEWPADGIWVVDGGSQDDPMDVAQRYGVRFLQIDAPSRARQMNAGAAASGGDVILFLHADTHLPKGAQALITEAILKGAVGGAFSRRFDNGSLFLRATCLTADWRGKWGGVFFGDQAIFATRDAFEHAGRFPEQPLFEDFEFTRRLSRRGRTVLLKPSVISSGRRFEKRGAFRQTLSDFLLTVRYACRENAIFGVPDATGRGSVGSPAILMFLKDPIPGQVKTRLAREIGTAAACEIYREMVHRQLAALPAGWPVEIHFSPASARANFAAWLGPSYAYHPQPEGDLGNRLQRATAAAFNRGHPNVILIGGDCPSLDTNDLEETERLLNNGADVVMGPALDGGYYLLGLRPGADALLVFEGIPWSTPGVARATSARIDALGLRLARLAEKEDVDDLAAYRRAVEVGNLKDSHVD